MRLSIRSSASLASLALRRAQSADLFELPTELHIPVGRAFEPAGGLGRLPYNLRRLGVGSMSGEQATHTRAAKEHGEMGERCPQEVTGGEVVAAAQETNGKSQIGRATEPEGGNAKSDWPGDQDSRQETDGHQDHSADHAEHPAN